MPRGNVSGVETMARSAPLRVTVEVRLFEGPARGERRFRLSQSVELPPLVSFAADLPLEGAARGEVAFEIPDGPAVEATALLRYDPEHPERGSSAELLAPEPAVLQALESYIDSHAERVERLTP